MQEKNTYSVSDIFNMAGFTAGVALVLFFFVSAPKVFICLYSVLIAMVSLHFAWCFRLGREGLRLSQFTLFDFFMGLFLLQTTLASFRLVPSDLKELEWGSCIALIIWAVSSLTSCGYEFRKSDFWENF